MNRHKLAVFGFCVFVMSSAAYAQDATQNELTGGVKGTLTFFMHEHQGKRADTGSLAVLMPGLVVIPEDATVMLITTLLSVDGKEYIPIAGAIADVNGTFDFSDIPAGKYTVVIQSANVRGCFCPEIVTKAKNGKPLKKPRIIRYTNQRDVMGRVVTIPVTVEAGKTAEVWWDSGV